ncbi:MAG: hypothetical protein ACLFM0_02285 [Spirochaetales bacterium]
MNEEAPRIESVVALVDSIDRARQRFGELGFTVSDASVALGSMTRQCAVAFADGTSVHFLERPRGLLARVRRRRTFSTRFRRKTEACGKYALRFRSLLSLERPSPGLVDTILRASIPPESSDSSGDDENRYEAGWITTDVTYRIGGEPGKTTMVVANRQPRELPLIRVSEAPLPFDEAATEHRNGIQGIFHVQVGVEDLDAALPVYKRLMRAEPYDHVDPVQRRAIFDLANGELELMPVETSLEAGVREISLRPGFPGHRVSYDAERTEGITMRVTDMSAKTALQPDEEEELEKTTISRSRRQ